MQNALNVGEYLLQAVKQLGVETIFGIPGDMIIKFFKLIENDPKIKLCTFSHEPAVGYAAIGSARALRKPAVACVTYGPGGLSLLNSVACAYSEKVPLIVIAGGPPMNVRADGFLMHHFVKSFDTQLKVYSEVTAEAVILDNPETAATKIAKTLAVCQETMLPVYIELPADMANVTMENPADEPSLQLPAKNELRAASAEITHRLSKAQKPVLMIGVEAVRFGLVNQIIAIAEKIGIPVVSTMLSRDEIPKKAPNFYGVYLGKAGNPDADKLVAESDFVLMLGEDLSDVNFGQKLAGLKAANVVRCVLGEVKTEVCTYRDVSLKTLVAKLLVAQISAKNLKMPEKTHRISPENGDTSRAIVTDDVINAVNLFFKENGEMPVISDTGDCLFATLRLESSSIIGASFYGTMGFAVPAAIGYALATKERPLVLVGDGGFQMTGQEICHCPRYGISPVFMVINNRRWGMEQLFYPSAHFNELVNWPYAKLADLWGGKGYQCDNCEKLYRALEDAKGQKCFTLIEVVTEREELSEELLAWIKEQRGEK